MSLHTVLHHRGKNLAVLLKMEVLRLQVEYFGAWGFEGRGDVNVENGSKLAHADVGEYCFGSQKVMEKVGERPLWKLGGCWA